MFESHYFSRSSLVHSLHGAISDGLWQAARHDDWGVDIAKMLTWQIGFQDKHMAYAPFCGKHLYALIMFGKLAQLLESLPSLSGIAKESDWLDMFDPEDYRSKHASQNPLDQAVWQQSKTLHSLMSALADRLIGGLDSQETEEFHHFWTHTRTAWLDDLHCRVEYEQLKE